MPSLPLTDSDSSLLARSSPAGFATVATRGKYQLPPHILLLNEKLVDVAAGRIKRLIITFPPRHGKSQLASKYFPAWYLCMYPDRRIILTSYEEGFAASWGRQARDIVREFGPSLFGVRVSDATESNAEWEVTTVEGLDEERPITPGGMICAGIRGPITGRGAHVAIIDDPVKNADDARSETNQANNIDWFRSTLYTRMESDPEGAIVVIQTRWHENDLTGQLLRADQDEDDELKEGWEVINLPAIAEENDPLGRQPGEALWPARFPVDRLRRIERRLGHWFHALYQQHPHPAEGGLFKRPYFRYYDEVSTSDGVFLSLAHENGDRLYGPHEAWHIATIDVAGTTKTTSDWTVITTLAVLPTLELAIRDVVRFRLEGPDQPDQVRFSYARWRHAVIGVETAFIGLTLFQQLIRMGLPIIELKTDVDKVARAIPAAARYKAGTIWHPRFAPWLETFEAELINFPNDAHDDQVDTIGHAARLLAQLEAGPPEETLVYEDEVAISPV